MASVINTAPSTVNGNMMQFDGTSSYTQMPNVPISNSYSATNAMTLEYWVYPQNTTTNGQVIIAKRPSTNDGGFFVELNGNVANHNVHTNIGWVNVQATYDLNTWNHIAITANGLESELRAYKNGKLVNTTSAGFNSYTDAVMRVGKDSEFSNANHWQGIMDELRMWNTSLNQSQIRENMHLTLTGAEDGLYAYYQFNEDSGDAIESIHGNNATLTGATRTTSTLSVGKGASKIINLSALGRIDVEVTLDNTRMEIDFQDGGTAPDGDLGIYQITSQTPYNNTTMPTRTTSCYWVVQNFGNVNAGLAIDSIRIRIPENDVISATDAAMPNNLKLYKRVTNSIDITWGGSSIASAVRADNISKEIVFPASSITSFSEFIVGSETSPLPITLLHFKGERVTVAGKPTENVQLDWATASEINNKGFDIEISTNGVDFRKIAFIDGKGNATTTQSYAYTTPQTEDAYYRLRQIDFDGKTSYSPVVFVEGINTLKVYPNPNKGRFTVQVGESQTPTQARLLNAQGIEVWRNTLPARLPKHTIKANLPAGLYFLQVIYEGKTRTTKIMVQR